MAAIEQIRRVVTQYDSSGAEKAAADLNAVAAAEANAARAGEQLATVTDTVSKRQLSAASAADKLRRSIDDEYRAQQQLAKGQATLDRAMQQGVLSAEEYARALTLLQSKVANTNSIAAPITAAGTATKLASHEMVNLTAQLHDIGVSLAGGMSPFTVMMQQGSQISAIMGDRGLKTILSGVGTALLSLINPTTAVLAAFTALYVGGSYALEALVGSSKSLEDQLKAHEAIIKQVKGAYDEAAGAAVKWEGASRAATAVRATAALKDLNKELAKASDAFLKASASFVIDPADPIGKDVFAGAKREFADFALVIGRFQQSAKDPAAWRALEDGIGRIAEGNPAIADAGKKLLDLLKAGLEAAAGYERLDATMRAVNGTADATDFSKIGLDKLKKDAEEAEKAIARLRGEVALAGNERAQAIDKEMRNLGTGASLDQRAEAYLLAGRKYDREQAAKEAEKRAREAQSEAKKASDELARDGKKVWEETRTAAEKYAAEIDKLNALLAKGAITQDTYARAAKKASDEMRDAQVEEQRKGLEKSNNPYDGVALAAMDYQKKAGSMAKQAAELTTSMFSSMEDAFVEFVKTGKINFKDLIDAMIADLARFMVRQAMMGFMNMLAGGVGGGSAAPIGVTGGAGPHVVPTFQHGGGLIGAEHSYRGAFPASLWADAPRFHSGGWLKGDEVPAILQRGEAVFTAGQMRALGMQMSAARQAAAQQAGSTFVNVQNYGQEKAQVRTTQRGSDRFIDVIIEKKLNSAIVGGRVDGAMKNRFGTGVRPTERG